MDNEIERIAKLEAKVDELEKQLNMQEQQIAYLQANVGKLPPWAATILTALVGTVIAALLRSILK